MTFTQWLRTRFAPRQASARRRPPARRPALERLEDRLTPSTGGLLDPTFGSGGTVVTSFANYYDSAQAVVAQPDGKVVVGGLTKTSGSRTGNDFLVARYNADGSLDASFGSGGHAVTDFHRGSDLVRALALQPQASGPAKIIAVGSATNANSQDVALTRYNADGTLDATFGTKGKVETSLNGTVGRGVAVDGSGRILVAAGTTLLRYTANGALDATFGNGGKAATGVPVNHPECIALQADGKIIVASSQGISGTGNAEFVLTRITSGGTVDRTFGSNGTVITHTNPVSNDSFGGVTLQSDGKIVVAGMEVNNDPDGVDRQGQYLLRYNTDGSLDVTFGSGGIAYLTKVGLLGENGGGVAVQADGKIVAGGTWFPDGQPYNYFGVMRVSSSGALDTGYGSGGWALTTFAYGTSSNGMALEPDGGVLLAGFCRPSGTTYPTDVALARFLPSAPQIGTFTASPSPATAGSPVTLTAGIFTDGNTSSTGVGATVTRVAYYVDSNGDGNFDPSTDALLGYGTRNTDGTWGLTFSTGGWSAGNYTLFAQATDSLGAVGDPFALAFQLV